MLLWWMSLQSITHSGITLVSRDLQDQAKHVNVRDVKKANLMAGMRTAGEVGEWRQPLYDF